MTDTRMSQSMNQGSNGRRRVRVDVTILSESGKGDFRLRSRNGNEHLPVQNDYMLVFDNNQGGHYSNGFEVRFSLTDDPLSSTYRFAQDLDEALWVKVVDNQGPCPKNRSSCAFFTPDRFEDEGRTLVVDNPNDAKVLFGFALGFEPLSGNGRILRYDPIGTNQNGQFR